MPTKKRWLLCAIEAWLKREAFSASRAYSRSSALVSVNLLGISSKGIQTSLVEPRRAKQVKGKHTTC